MKMKMKIDVQVIENETLSIACIMEVSWKYHGSIMNV